VVSQVEMEELVVMELIILIQFHLDLQEVYQVLQQILLVHILIALVLGEEMVNLVELELVARQQRLLLVELKA
jgi:hypothetical protein